MNVDKLVGNTPMIKIDYEYVNMKAKREAFILKLNITTILEALKTE